MQQTSAYSKDRKQCFTHNTPEMLLSPERGQKALGKFGWEKSSPDTVSIFPCGKQEGHFTTKG